MKAAANSFDRQYKEHRPSNMDSIIAQLATWTPSCSAPSSYFGWIDDVYMDTVRKDFPRCLVIHPFFSMELTHKHMYALQEQCHFGHHHIRLLVIPNHLINQWAKKLA